VIIFLRGDTPFPPVETALRSPNGLLAAGGDLSLARLLDAYRHGIFPWFNADDPILWWSPDPRMVLFPQEFRISRSLRKTLRKGAYEIRTDTAFEQVMRACATAPREGQRGTWIHEDMIAAYTALYCMGYAHSVEVWVPRTTRQLQVEGETRRQRANDDENAVSVDANLASEVKPTKGGGNYSTDSTARSEQGSQRSIADELELAGGLYGVSIGHMFYGESMFSRRSNASKVALAHLAAQLTRWNFGMIDCQMSTPHLAALGAREIPRTEFIRRLQELIHYPDIASPWKFEDVGGF
jgi:leucyl/phenylalanyl-tRNA---protein transferase